MAGIAKREAPNGNDEAAAQAQVDIWRFVFGFTEMAAVKCAVELGIPDILENHQGDPMTLSELSSALSCSSTVLFRIMRFLMNRGIFKEKITNQGSMGYVQSPLSSLLTKDGKNNSLATMLLFQSSPVTLAPWHFLSARVLDDKTSAFVCAHGKDVWQYAAENPGYRKLIDEALACYTRTVPAVLDGCPEVFNGLSSVVDVGGGNGTALGILIKMCPWIRGINFDLPHVLSAAPICEGIEHVGGDMFISVPKANAVFLKWVLHDWNDDECIQILKNCREAISEYNTTGKVVIVEAVIEDKEGDRLKDVGLMQDMVMLAIANKGKERTAEEWAYVLHEAGFTRHTIKNIRAVSSVIEAYP